MFWQLSIHWPYLQWCPSVFVLRHPSLPPSLLPRPCGSRGIHSHSRYTKSWLMGSLHSRGPRDFFGDGLWPHQNQGNLWPEERTLPEGWDWSWICEDGGAGIRSLILSPTRGLKMRPTKWAAGDGENPAVGVVGWIHLYLKLALFWTFNLY